MEYLDRDLSWISFNERVLLEAADPAVPLLERINFLSIYSSNLDEFYRVHIPALMALARINKGSEKELRLLETATDTIRRHQELYGSILRESIIPQLRNNNIHLVYGEAIPDELKKATQDYFYTRLLAYLQPVALKKENASFFPENNSLYIAVVTDAAKGNDTFIVNIPSQQTPRFFSTAIHGKQYVVFIDDIIKDNLAFIFPGTTIAGTYSLKITRDAELELEDEYTGNIAEKIEKQIAKRDYGFATRFLYQPGLPEAVLAQLVRTFNLGNAGLVAGGQYHNLRDLSSFPVKNKALSYTAWPALQKATGNADSLLKSMEEKDFIIHTPYHRYDEVLRFFNETAVHPDVEEIYLTLYRMAGDSRIGHALISAARNGKKVTVFVELKARFDEANNIRWAKRMKEAGIRIIYSIPGLKVHAKIALVKKKNGQRIQYYGLLSTGNFNETTARFYTDHILFTTHKEMLRELELLFLHLMRRKKPDSPSDISFNHLLVAQFNLPDGFAALIDREIANAQQGLPAAIQIKLNNLEEKKLIRKLYEASEAGVKISLIVRSICCLMPGIDSQSKNIAVKRIVDRYLEHGRVFMFHNNGDPVFYLGSADWMNRNIYRRIEVCFPVYDPEIKGQLQKLFELQWSDNVQAVWIDRDLTNQRVQDDKAPVRSQEAIYNWVSDGLPLK